VSKDFALVVLVVFAIAAMVVANGIGGKTPKQVIPRLVRWLRVLLGK